MNTFASLMALSATHTQENQVAVKRALQERQRKEALQRKQQQERDAKERETEKKIRIQKFEEEKKQKEKAAQMEAELKAKELARERREEEQRNVLLYGRKKAAKIAASAGSSPRYPQSAAASRESSATRKRLGGVSDDEATVSHALTREELRQKKSEAELRRQLVRATTKRSTTSGYRKDGQALPGGAVNIVVNANGESVTPVSAVSSDPTGSMSLKERLTQGPNTLVLLQTKARDRRTVDEAQQDIRIKLGKAPNKLLSGDDAKNFDDWFGSSRDKEKEKVRSPAPRSASSTPVPSSSSMRTSQSSAYLLSSQKKAPGTIFRPSSTKPATSCKPSDLLRTTSLERATTSSYPASLKMSKAGSNSSNRPTMSAPSGSSQSSNSSAKAALPKLKRRRSLSRSESPPPKRQQRDSDKFDIWEHMTGKSKREYVMRDIDSDESDMEADAFGLLREEHVSARIAHKEDQLALEEERQREEEKRRRKDKQRAATSRGY